MTKRLDGKVAIVTGGARGMGASHVRRFVAEGARVVFGDLLEEEGKALASELGENATFVRLDVTSAEDWNTVIQTAKDTYGAPTVLVNNAGISGTNLIPDTTEEEFRRLLDINLVSTFLGIKAIAPVMKEAGGGSIVNISSVSGLVGAPGTGGYAASKFGVRGLTKAAATELGADGIRVNSVHPGVVRTPMTAGLMDTLDQVVAMLPLQRVAEPEEVSSMVLYLASDESGFSTGSEFVIDGGFTAL